MYSYQSSVGDCVIATNGFLARSVRWPLVGGGRGDAADEVVVITLWMELKFSEAGREYRTVSRTGRGGSSGGGGG